MLPCSIVSTSIALPGISGIESFIDLLRHTPLEFSTDTVDLPASDLLPIRLKRRMSRLIQMTVSTTFQARQSCAGSADAPLVYGSANGEINTIGSVLNEIFQEPPLVSPSAFHNSVHNSAPGYWSILTRLHHASTTISAGETTFGCALLQAAAMLSDRDPFVQLTVGDEKIQVPQWADPGHTNIDFCGSMVLSRHTSGDALAHIIDLRHMHGPEATEYQKEAHPIRIASGYRHPCAAFYVLLEFLHAPSSSGRIKLVEGDPESGCIGMTIERS